MKVKPSSRSGSVVVELNTGEEQFPPSTLPEIKLKTILVPVDFSESSRKALHYAVSFARQFNAEILLLHSVELPSPPPETILTKPGLIDADAQNAADKRLSEWRKQIGSSTAVKVAARTGKPTTQIVEEAKRSHADLIVMGTHGRTGLSHLLIGSTAEQVVRHAPCPVMVVREQEHDFVEMPRDRTGVEGARPRAA